MRKNQAVSKTSAVFGQSKEVGIYAVAAAVNDLLAMGAADISTELQIHIPDYAFSSRVNTMKKHLKRACREHHIELADIAVQKHSAINVSMVIATALGECPAPPIRQKKELTGKEIILTKWVGMTGMLRILDEKEDVLNTRFSPSFINQIRSFKEFVFDCREIKYAVHDNADYIRQITDGGVFAGLWDICQTFDTGIDVDLKKIAVRQETIEICECFRLNPYQLYSQGCFLILAKDGKSLVRQLHEQGIEAGVIGRLTDNNDKIIRNGNEIRYLDRPVVDEIWGAMK